jgi:methylase of polypeptide subunit release factors
MSLFSVSGTKMLEEAHTKLDGLVDAHNGHVKELFIDSVRNNHSHDSMGQLFEKSLEKFERKDMGQYYTPKSIVEYMISQLDIKRDSKVLDPSCGCGSFLLTLFDVFKEKYGIQFIKNIFGVDMNDDATDMTRLCLSRKSGFKDNYVPLIRQNIKTGNSIVSSKVLDKSAFDWNFEFRDVLKNGGFDFIIGNPPYVTLTSADFDASESIYDQITKGPVNAATLMIGKSLDLLKENGILAFLLPKSILYVDSYAKLRNYLAHNTEILQIYDLGSKFKDVRGEQFILFVRKSIPNKESCIKVCVFKDKAKGLPEQSFITIKQDKLTSMGKFFTFDSPAYYELVAKTSDIGMKLNDYVAGKIFRGLPIGGNHVANEKNLSGSEPVIRGKDISKFRLKSLPVMDKNLLDKQSKGKIESLKHRKVVLQNIFSAESGVIAVYDSNKALTLDTVTNVIVEDDEKGKYLLALLSSKLINFYIMYALFNRSRLTMHMDKSYLGSIPIIANPNKGKLNKLVKIIDFLMKNEDIELRKSKNREIDEIVYDIYYLTDKEIKMVEEATAKIFSKKSIW